LLLELSALGRGGIQRAGGLAAWARRHNASVNTLRQLIRTDGSLTALGQIKIDREVHALPSEPITGPLLQKLSTLGSEGIQRAGGVMALASRHNVSVHSLRHLIHKDSSLTARGQDRIEREALA
jgi:hypothetical protein